MQSGFAFDSIFFAVAGANGGSFVGFTPISGAPGWQTIEVQGLTQADFGGRDLAGSLDLRFGFGFLSDGDVSFGDETIVVGVDDFAVLVTVVPEPGTALLLGAGMVLLAAQRRRFV